MDDTQTMEDLGHSLYNSINSFKHGRGKLYSRLGQVSDLARSHGITLEGIIRTWNSLANGEHVAQSDFYYNAR